MIICRLYHVVSYMDLTSGLQLSGQENAGMGDTRATVPPIVKLYIYCTHKVAHGLDLISPYIYFFRYKFQIKKILDLYLLCQVKSSDEINTWHVYLSKKKLTSMSLWLAIVGLKILNLNLSLTFTAIFDALKIRPIIIQA